jgi:hypothetical protein
MKSSAEIGKSESGWKAKYLDHPNAPVIQLRLANLEEILHAYGSKAKLARQLGISTAQLGQYFAVEKDYFRPIGDAMARKIEVAIGLPAYALDQPKGVAGIKLQIGASRLPANSYGQPLLKPLHQASLDAFRDALTGGRVSDTECIALLSKWTQPDGLSK